MEKLNELAEQAKFIADWHGSDWSSALCQKKDGKQAHEIICESRGESVISTGSNSNEASWLCDYLELCSPENILTIAESFRELEQRAEAAEAKLAGLESREALGWQFEQCEGESCDNGAVVNVSGADVHLCAECSRDKKYSRMKINALPKRLTRPAPAADLAELVPVPPEFLSAEQNSQGMFELSEDCMTRLAIALSQQAKGLVIKPGHALVPVEPTAAMYAAGDQQLTTKQAWNAMLAAAPEVE